MRHAEEARRARTGRRRPGIALMERVREAALGVGLGLLAGPGTALACSVCTAGRDEENQLAFLLSTIFMSLLPLMVIGTIVGAIWWRVRRLGLGSEPEPEPESGTVAGGASEGAAASHGHAPRAEPAGRLGTLSPVGASAPRHS